MPRAAAAVAAAARTPGNGKPKDLAFLLNAPYTKLQSIGNL